MGRKRILVVDDNEDLADGLSELMEMQGYEVDVAFTGNAATEMAAEKNYDFIFVDIGLPDINGVECAARIREGGSRAQVLFMTGYSAADIPERISEVRGAELLIKPLDPNRILDRIG